MYGLVYVLLNLFHVLYTLFQHIYYLYILYTCIYFYIIDTKATSSPLHRPFDSFLDLKMPSTNGVSGGLLPGDEEDSDDGEEEEEEGQNYDPDDQDEGSEKHTLKSK